LLPGISDLGIDPSLSLHENVNKQAAIIIQIESLEGIKNLDAILTEAGEHIDSVWLGSLDARVSMGLSGFVGQEPEWLEALAVYESALAKYNKPASGLALGSTEMKASMSRGKSFMVVSADMHSLVGQGLQDLGHFRQNWPKQNYEGVYKEI
jgi:4-hydroxy-2-oxoheptanedioate aldolase